MNIRTATTESEIRACYPAMHELRPHLSEEAFVSQVQRQMQNHGYVLVYIAAEGEVTAAAGYRIAEFLAWGKACYLDDLVTRESARKHGYGGMLLDWLMNKAEALGCRQFHLDSGVQRHDAHRLYLGHKMQITSHHFAKALA
jgi:GNAT superfamily N-acetyltransferase